MRSPARPQVRRSSVRRSARKRSGLPASPEPELPAELGDVASRYPEVRAALARIRRDDLGRISAETLEEVERGLRVRHLEQSHSQVSGQQRRRQRAFTIRRE
eukprot:9496985-Pyramimonas_sp.AAC.1